MKITNKKTGFIINDLFLYLNPKEAKELSSEFQKLLDNPREYIINIPGEDHLGKLSKIISIKIEYK